MKKSEIEQQDRMMLTRQTEFRMAADAVTDAWMRFPEVVAVAVIGSVAKRLWLRSQDHLHEVQRAGSQGLHPGSTQSRV